MSGQIFFIFFGSFTPPPPPLLIFSFERLNLLYQIVMKFCIVNKLAIVNRFVLHTLHRNITYSAIIKRKTTEKNEKLKFGGGGGEWRRAIIFLDEKARGLESQIVAFC